MSRQCLASSCSDTDDLSERAIHYPVNDGSLRGNAEHLTPFSSECLPTLHRFVLTRVTFLEHNPAQSSWGFCRLLRLFLLRALELSGVQIFGGPFGGKYHGRISVGPIRTVYSRS
jgi:hypothetical protein